MNKCSSNQSGKPCPSNHLENLVILIIVQTESKPFMVFIFWLWRGPIWPWTSPQIYSDPLKSIGISWSQGPRHQKGPRRNLQRQSAAGPRLCGANRKVGSFEMFERIQATRARNSQGANTNGWAPGHGEWRMESHLDHFSRDVSRTLVATKRKHDHEGGMKATIFGGEQPTQMALQPIRV